MVRVLAVATAIVLAVALPGAAPTAAAQPAESAAPATPRQQAAERAARHVLDGRYQDDSEPADGGGAGSGAGSGARSHRPTRPDRPGSDGAPRGHVREVEHHAPDAPLGTLTSYLMWGVLIAGLVLLAGFIARDLFKYADDPGPVTADGAVVVEAPRAELARPLGDADELAAQGRFAEAIHTLLLRTFQELARTSAVRITPSLTSREILARIPLLGDARDALADLVAVVELTWFGDDVPGAADWDRCRGQFHRFASAYRAAPAGSAA
ncbi:MAG: DUF4129 domain-containing protein [Kofleriaceae bacterium]|nr:DUF4129 domain-containing protein [Kofleriaceae bacterium]